jgi:4'-phosphopantetheinyl transferase
VLIETALIEPWLLPLDLSPSLLDQLHTLLDADERTRAGRFHRDEDRRRFVARRGQLRLILSAYCDRPAADIGYAFNEFGKPSLRDRSDVSFSTSHSGDVGLCVVSGSGIEVGCDIERHDPAFIVSDLIERICTAGERSQIDALPDEQRHRRFLDCWTRKEAYVKSMGMGFSLAPERFDVPLNEPDDDLFVGRAGGRPLYAIPTLPGFHAAICTGDGSGAPKSARWFEANPGS